MNSGLKKAFKTTFKQPSSSSPIVFLKNTHTHTHLFFSKESVLKKGVLLNLLVTVE